MREARKPVALYLRQSLDRAEGIASQRTRATKLAEARGWRVVEAFEDNEVRASRVRGRDTSWARMLDRIGTDFSVVIATDLDRLLRSTKDLNTLIDKGAQVVTVDGEIDLSTADGEFRATMLAGVARFEVRRASERQKNSKRHRAERGMWHGGNVPYGYRPVTPGAPAVSATDTTPEVKAVAPKGPLILDEREAGLLREAAEKLLAGDTMYGITKAWNDSGVRTGRASTKPRLDGKVSPQHWRQVNLRAKLLNPAVTGMNKLGIKVAEPVLDHRTFERVRDLLTEPSRNIAHSPGARSAKYTMAGGLTICGECGIRMYGIRHREKIVLSCVAHANPGLACGRNRIDHDLLERYIFDVVIGSLKADPRWLDGMRRSSGDDQRASELRMRREQLADQSRRLNELYVLGEIERRQHAEQSQRIREETEGVAEQLRQVDGPRVIDPDEVADLNWVSWGAWSPARRRQFLMIALAKIEVLHDETRFSPPRRRAVHGETVEEFEQRRSDYVTEVMGRRVRLTL